ncbi:hypothetical protein AB1Y20_017144 [Prymnesium parvum]|uniref:ADP-ribosylation factor 6 n=1 Tax=Prymnesium parvum TaxID=97485 RepID=A0AB34IBN7_PRYPA|mmetsp:Transcript_33861/g.77625  ORF Transcript_33861/g.77625 Transcript_33861/m.77625 type:complete len:177 (+) Transcript_33861:34-564(+)
MGGASGKEMKVLIAGLDAAGKTTVLYKLKKGEKKKHEAIQTIPTLDFNVETCKYKKHTFSIWDVGGQDSIRPLWRHHFTGTQGLIYVVDSADRQRVRKAAEELHKIVLDHEMRFAVTLIVANKADLPHALSPDEIKAELKLDQLGGRTFHVQPTCATTGEGLWEGMKWLAENVKPI